MSESTQPEGDQVEDVETGHGTGRETGDVDPAEGGDGDADGGADGGEVSEAQGLGETQPGADAVPSQHTIPTDIRDPEV